MITTGNYFSRLDEINPGSLPDKLKAGHKYLEKFTQNGVAWHFYEKSPQVKKAIDEYLVRLNNHLGKGKPEAASPAKAEQATNLIPPTQEEQDQAKKGAKKMRFKGWNFKGVQLWEDKHDIRYVREGDMFRGERMSVFTGKFGPATEENKPPDFQIKTPYEGSIKMPAQKSQPIQKTSKKPQKKPLPAWLTRRNEKDGSLFKFIGWNPQGEHLWQDKNGVRHRIDGKIIYAEPVLLLPGGGTGTHPENRKPEDFKLHIPYEQKTNESTKKNAPAPKKGKTATTNKKSTKRSTSTSKSKGKRTGTKKAPKVDPNYVRDLDVEYRLISRFVNTYNKRKTYKQLLAIFQAVNKAVKKGHVRKTQDPTPFHKEIEYIQGRLQYVLKNLFKTDDELEQIKPQWNAEWYGKLKKIKDSFAVWPSVRMAIRFIGIEGKAPEKDKAQNLLDQIVKAEKEGKIAADDPNKGFVRKMKSALSKYLGGKAAKVSLHPQELQGLCGAVHRCGCMGEVPGKPFLYWINLDERGDFNADVRDRDKNTIWEIHDIDHLGDLIQDGYMRHKGDVSGLEKYLRETQVIGRKDWLITSEAEFDQERDWAWLDGLGKLPAPDTGQVRYDSLVDVWPASATAHAPSPIRTATGADGDFLIPPTKGRAVSFSSDSLPPAHEKTYKFAGRWEGLFNSPVVGFSMLIYGKPKSGKSTMAADFGGYLARNHGRVLYASIEEGARGTITERINRLGVAHPDMVIKNYLPVDLSGYDFVITDSVSRGNVNIEMMRNLINQWPTVSFIFIFHTTKDGLPRGTQEYLHEVDAIVKVDKGHAAADGRFGPGEMPVRFE
ncbi:MAG: hypothetical protein AAGN35_15345 [Bacteroidota bacterium]